MVFRQIQNFNLKIKLIFKKSKKIFAIFLKIWKKSRDTYKMCREFLYIGNRDLTFFYKDYNFREKISWFFSVFKIFFKQIKIAIFFIIFILTLCIIVFYKSSSIFWYIKKHQKYKLNILFFILIFWSDRPINTI